MAEYPDVRPGGQTVPPNVRPTPNLGAPQPSTNVNVSQRSTLGPAVAAAAVVILVGLVAWNVLADREAPTAPVPASDTTAPVAPATPDTSPGVLPAPTPPEVIPEPAPAPDSAPVAPTTGTTTAPSN
jgi:hypothetical protein